MSYRELFITPSPVFGGVQRSFEEAEYVFLGVPLDVTSTYRSGSRFAPISIREASLNIETYSFRAKIDFEDVKVHDLGDLHVTGRVDETLKRIERVSKDLLEAKKTIVAVGGEHTITLGIVGGIEDDFALVSFDAHLDLRNDYIGRTVSHSTFMHRICDRKKPEKILEIGTRAVCKEELAYANKLGVPFITVQEIREDGVDKTVQRIARFLANYQKVYLTIDMDVLDPAFAPAVQNPEPDGLSIQVLLDLVCQVCRHPIVGLDLVEVTPHYDNGATSLQAAKIIFEAVNHMHACTRERSGRARASAL